MSKRKHKIPPVPTPEKRRAVCQEAGLDLGTRAGLAAASGDPSIVTVEPSRCRACGSIERSDYHHTTVQDYAGVRDGRPFTRIVRRYTECLACGQARVDKTFE